MLSLLAIVLLIATLMTLFYQQISRGIGSAVFVIVWLLCGFLASWLFHPISLILLAAGVTVLNHVDLRQRFITKPVYNALGKVMPAIGDTDREAIEAGTTSLEPDLFSRRPDRDHFATTHFPTLTHHQPSFITHHSLPSSHLLDQWQPSHQLAHLPAPACECLTHH